MTDILLSPLRLSELEILIEKSVVRAIQVHLAYPPSNSADDTKHIGINEAAEMLGITKQTVYQNIGRIPHTKRHGRLYFTRKQLREYLNTTGA